MKDPVKRLLTSPRSQWEATLEEVDEARERSQAGEIMAGDEDGGGGDKGIDADTGDGGYGGDAALAGANDAEWERPLDAEIHGDPRTHEGDEYPSDLKAMDPTQGPIANEARGLDEE
jgi:hypothetical protein